MEENYIRVSKHDIVIIKYEKAPSWLQQSVFCHIIYVFLFLLLYFSCYQSSLLSFSLCLILVFHTCLGEKVGFPKCTWLRCWHCECSVCVWVQMCVCLLLCLLQFFSWPSVPLKRHSYTQHSKTQACERCTPKDSPYMCPPDQHQQYDECVQWDRGLWQRAGFRGDPAQHLLQL